MATAIRSGSGTRERLIAAAERLFAERGIDRVSLNEITRAAGQRNASALQYHLGGREELIQAILEKHQPGIARDREAMLDELEARSGFGLRDLAEAAVLPLARKLDDPDGGLAYLCVMDQLIGGPARPLLEVSVRGVMADRDRLIRLTRRALPGRPAPVLRMRALLVAGQMFRALAGLGRREQAGLARPGERELFVENLIDCHVGVLEAPLSPATRRLVARLRR